MVRLATDDGTRAYLERRVSEGKTKTEAVRCIKRYLAREIFAAPPKPPPVDSGSIGSVRSAWYGLTNRSGSKDGLCCTRPMVGGVAACG